MIVGVPSELKPEENRVALVPAGVEDFVSKGHQVMVEQGAGSGSGFGDEDYRAAGASILPGADEVWEAADLILKVKEPVPVEYGRMRGGQTVFTYFHFAADETLTRATLDSGCTAIAYETVELPSGELPLLTPMSEVAGRMAVQEGARFLSKVAGGAGVLLGGVPGVEPGLVVILGGGVVGTNAAFMASGLGARVIIMDVSLPRMRYLEEIMPANVTTVFSNHASVVDAASKADLLIGAVLVTGGKAPVLLRAEDIKKMQPGSVIVDVAVDQGGCVETARPTTHADPVFVVDDVVHYCVSNMPGAVPRTSTLALTNATLPYALRIADTGWADACKADPCLALGVNAVGGRLTYAAVGEAFGFPSTTLEEVLG